MYLYPDHPEGALLDRTNSLEENDEAVLDLTGFHLPNAIRAGDLMAAFVLDHMQGRITPPTPQLTQAAIAMWRDATGWSGPTHQTTGEAAHGHV